MNQFQPTTIITDELRQEPFDPSNINLLVKDQLAEEKQITLNEYNQPNLTLKVAVLAAIIGNKSAQKYMQHDVEKRGKIKSKGSIKLYPKRRIQTISCFNRKPVGPLNIIKRAIASREIKEAITSAFFRARCKRFKKNKTFEIIPQLINDEPANLVFEYLLNLQ